jgi:hypothetical protein
MTDFLSIRNFSTKQKECLFKYLFSAALNYAFLFMRVETR